MKIKNNEDEIYKRMTPEEKKKFDEEKNLK